MLGRGLAVRIFAMLVIQARQGKVVTVEVYG